MSERPTVVSYDISDDRIRAKARKIISEYRLDGQKSVHECCLDREQAESLFLQLCELVDPVVDSILLARLDRHRRVLSRGRKTASVLGEPVRHLI